MIIINAFATSTLPEDNMWDWDQYDSSSQFDYREFEEHAFKFTLP